MAQGINVIGYIIFGMRILMTSTFLFCLTAFSMSNAENLSKHNTTKLIPICLTQFQNSVKKITEDGRDVIIIKAWNDEGGVGGHWTYMVTVNNNHQSIVVGSQSKKQYNTRYIIPFVNTVNKNSGDLYKSTISDAPQNNNVAVIFSRGILDGVSGVYVLNSKRKENTDTFYITVYKLIQVTNSLDGQSDVFTEVKSWYNDKKYHTAFDAIELSNVKEGCSFN